MTTADVTTDTAATTPRASEPTKPSGAGRRFRPRPSRFSAGSWFLGVLAVMAVLMVVFALVGAHLLARTNSASDTLSEKIAPARTSLARLEAALVDEETGVRGYLLAGDRQFLQPYTDGRTTEQQAERSLDTLLAGRPASQRAVASVVAAAGSWQRQDAVPLIADADAHRQVSQAQLDASKNAFDSVRVTFATAEQALDHDQSHAHADLVHTRTVRNWTFAAMLLVFFAAELSLALLLRWAVLRPLRALRLATRQVSDGEFDHVIAPSGPSDLQAVAADVDAMRDRLVRALTAADERGRALARQAAELDGQAVELRRSNAELEQFAYVASHDLQEPLRKVSSFCQLIEKRYDDQLDDRGRQYIAYAVDGAKRMQVLINDLLAFSRVGRMHDERRPVPLAEPLAVAVRNLEEAVTETGAVLELPDGLPVVTGDPTLLTMLWQNLLGNAIKFHAPDRPPHVTLTWERGADGAAHFAVADDGIGIGEEYREKVFVIFQRLHGRDAYQGTGIGLAMCKKIVEHHGGRIWIESGRETGACIRFTLPLPPPADPADAADAAAESGEDGSPGSPGTEAPGTEGGTAS